MYQVYAPTAFFFKCAYYPVNGTLVPLAYLLLEVWGLGLVSMRHACALTSQVLLLPLFRGC
jgi:hypothetical protein